MTTIRIPAPHTASYRASAHLHKSGPLTPEQLLAAVHFAAKPSSRLISLDSVLRTGWLVEIAGKIDISEDARSFFEGVEPVKLAGQIAAVRDHGSVYDRPALSRKHIPSSRGNRDDVPEFSVRAPVSFRTLAGGI